MLRDLAVLQEMVIEVAKAEYRKSKGRERVPRGFSDGIEFRLSNVEEGSAILSISLFPASLVLPGMEHRYQNFYDEARNSIIGAIAAVQTGEQPKQLPPKCLAYFDRFGRSLRDGEAIEFHSDSDVPAVRLTKETRMRLLEASGVSVFTQELELRGTVFAANQDAMTFELKLADGKKVSGPIPEEQSETILEAFAGYREGACVKIRGIAKYLRGGKLDSIQEVEQVNLLDSLDVGARLDELRLLKDGWLDGHGRALKAAEVNWFAEAFDAYFDDELQLPYVYPTESGGLRLEWELDGVDISLDVNLSTKIGAYHQLEMTTGDEESEELRLSGTEGWASLLALLNRLSGTS